MKGLKALPDDIRQITGHSCMESVRSWICTEKLYMCVLLLMMLQLVPTLKMR